jgi:hypothetical protein
MISKCLHDHHTGKNRASNANIFANHDHYDRDKLTEEIENHKK